MVLQRYGQPNDFVCNGGLLSICVTCLAAGPSVSHRWKADHHYRQHNLVPIHIYPPPPRHLVQGGEKFRPGTISQGIISPGENFTTLEIPKAPSKHVSRKMSLNFRKKFFVSRSLYAP